ncbi:MAG: hypothetical protein CM1200mP28_12430 [Deltaproteobacteria bacterium]|nr:MAG: hypothetical protein CM1200mP28_12430 [Deltaproteobacteria bacterium]
MTANLDTNLTEKFKVAGNMLDKHGLVVLHIKGCDIAAHNKEPVKKKDFLQKIDSELGKFLKKGQINSSGNHPRSLDME